ncbi:MAG: serine/threonine protein kinase [Candidatus Dadabacteria bacterium]|nr:MAG: serine/threonine protein kinase [Candidatus Dadabacteria bacterium]
MAEEHTLSLQPGTIIAGKYEVVKCLGAGSMGLVYACRHRELPGHLVAVKVIFPEVAQDKTAAQRFRNEIFASYGVSHPNVVRAYEYIRDGDLIAYTMEYVSGGDLAERLGRGEVFPIEEAVSILKQMCLGVQAIHDAGIIHRDLKPENILLTRDGQVKIADFGIARTAHGPKLTEHGGVIGTIDYVSPEYIVNSHVDWRSDIYAMGILAYEMITAQSPFRGDSVYATITNRLKTDPKPPSELRVECPKELDKIILKAIARDPEERYQSAMEMYQDLEAFMPSSKTAPTTINKASSSHITVEEEVNETVVASPAVVKEPLLENPSDTMIYTAEEQDNQETVVHTTALSSSETKPAKAKEWLNSSKVKETTAPVEEDTLVNDNQESFIEESNRLESVLSTAYTSGWAETNSQGLREEEEDKGVVLSGGALSSDRLKSFAYTPPSNETSWLLYFCAGLLFFIVGIGVTFFVISKYFPELLSPGASSGDEIVVSVGE